MPSIQVSPSTSASTGIVDVSRHPIGPGETAGEAANLDPVHPQAAMPGEVRAASGKSHLEHLLDAIPGGGDQAAMKAQYDAIAAQHGLAEAERFADTVLDRAWFRDNAVALIAAAIPKTTIAAYDFDLSHVDVVSVTAVTWRADTGKNNLEHLLDAVPLDADRIAVKAQYDAIAAEQDAGAAEDFAGAVLDRCRAAHLRKTVEATIRTAIELQPA